MNFNIFTSRLKIKNSMQSGIHVFVKSFTVVAWSSPLVPPSTKIKATGQTQTKRFMYYPKSIISGDGPYLSKIASLEGEEKPDPDKDGERVH